LALPHSSSGDFFLHSLCAGRGPIYSSVIAAMFLPFPTSSEAGLAVPGRSFVGLIFAGACISARRALPELAGVARRRFRSIKLLCVGELFVMQEASSCRFLAVESFRWWQPAGRLADGVTSAGQRRKRRVKCSVPLRASRSFASAWWRFSGASGDKTSTCVHMLPKDLSVIYLSVKDAFVLCGTFCSHPLYQV